MATKSLSLRQEMHKLMFNCTVQGQTYTSKVLQIKHHILFLLSLA